MSIKIYDFFVFWGHESSSSSLSLVSLSIGIVKKTTSIEIIHLMMMIKVVKNHYHHHPSMIEWMNELYYRFYVVYYYHHWIGTQRIFFFFFIEIDNNDPITIMINLQRNFFSLLLSLLLLGNHPKIPMCKIWIEKFLFIINIKLYTDTHTQQTQTYKYFFSYI